MQNKEKILLIDGFNILIAQNSLPTISNMVDSNSNPIGTYLTTINMIKIFVDRIKPTKILFVLDGPNSGERRRKLFSGYKNGRRIKSRESKIQIQEGDETSEFVVEGAFQQQMLKVYEFLKLLPVSVLMIPSCEADDVIAYLALKNKNKYDCVIVSNDRDYLQLVQDGIMVYRWKEKRLYDKNEVIKEFNILPENFIFRKIMSGDVSDCISGVKGIGDKTLVRFEKPLSEKIYIDMGEFFDMVETMDLEECTTREKNAIKKILDFKKEMLLAYRLMKLDESCLMMHHQDILKVQLQEQNNKSFQRFNARIQMSKDGFHKLYEKLHERFNEDKWLQTFAFVKQNIIIND